MNIFSNTLALVLSCIFCVNVWAGPAAPIEVVLSQPNGTTFTAIPRGDEFADWMETSEGHSIVNKNGIWYYAERNVTGALRATNAPVGSLSLIDLQSIPLHLAPTPAPEAFAPRTIRKIPRSGGSSDQAKALALAIPHSQYVLTVLVDYSDISFSYSDASFQSLMYGASDSVREFFLDNSYAGFTVTAAVESYGTSDDGIIHVARATTHPNPGGDSGVARAEAQTVVSLTDSFINYATYDTNGDGAVSPEELSIVIILAGYENSYGGASSLTPNVWGHQYAFPSNLTLDGVSLQPYAMFGEAHATSLGNKHQATIGIMCHELGHLMLGLPDLYDTDQSSRGIGVWGLMGGGSWTTSGTFSGDSPSHLSAWSKVSTNFTIPQDIDSNQSGVNIAKADTNEVAKRLWIDKYRLWEYFLVENRQISGYDAGLPGNGLLIWHIDDRQSTNSDENHKLVDVEEADGEMHLDFDINGGDAGDPFPGSSSNTIFNDTSTPDSKDYFGIATLIGVTGISASSETMTADFTTPSVESGDNVLYGGGSVGWGVGYDSTTAWAGLHVLNNTTKTNFDGVEVYVTDAVGATVDINYYTSMAGGMPSGLIHSQTGFVVGPGWNRLLLTTPQPFPVGTERGVVLKIVNNSYTYPISFDPSGESSGRSYYDSNGVGTFDHCSSTCSDINLAALFSSPAPSASIDIEKSTNGVDADTAPGPQLSVGDSVNWSYVVTNTSDVSLTGISVMDDQGVTVDCPGTELAAGANMTCTASGTAVAGQYSNIGSVTATPPTGPIVSDSDTSHYFGWAPTEDFVTTWKTDNPGTSNSTSITVPMIGGPYDVDWEDDGSFDGFGVSGSVTHDYGVAGIFTIRIHGNYDSIRFNAGGDKEKILSVDQWGTNSWTSMESAFSFAKNLTIPAIDTPDFSSVSNMSGMFSGATSANPNTSGWDTSAVTDMSHMFSGATSANPDTSSWDVSAVTDMSYMFIGASSANPNTSGWDTSAVTDMSHMFRGAGKAKPNTSGWNTAAVTNMSSMFLDANFARPDTSGWNTSSVTDMSHMFEGALDAQPDTSSWDTSAVTTMFQMFANARWITLDTSGWNTAAVTNMSGMFMNANWAEPDTSGWDTAAVTNMSQMFLQANFADPDTSGWDTAAVTDMRRMFIGATSANPDTSTWDTSAVTNMSNMFAEATSADPNTSGWNTSAVTEMYGMFSGATSANPDTSSWNTAMVDSMNSMFSSATSANPDTSNWDTSAVTTMSHMFYKASAANPDTSSWNTTKVTSMYAMFWGATLANPDVSGWVTGAVTTMRYMFDSATSFDQNIGSWDVSSLTDAQNMFTGAALSTKNYDSLLTGWAAQTLQPGVTFSGGNSTYCSEAAIAARANMIASDSWVITDGGQSCPPNYYCNIHMVSGHTDYFEESHEACESLILGPDYVAEEESIISANSGMDIFFAPEFRMNQGSTLDANICGQSLCETSAEPIPYGCHSCVDQICDIDPTCCNSDFHQGCLDKVNSVCGLTCEQ